MADSLWVRLVIPEGVAPPGWKGLRADYVAEPFRALGGPPAMTV